MQCFVARVVVTTIFTVSLASMPVATRAQDAVPGEMLYRTVPIAAGDHGGTGFFLVTAGKLYLVTARHVVNSLPPCDAQVDVWFSDQWKSLTAKRVLVPDSDADVAVLETQWEPPAQFSISAAGDSDGPTFGQQVWFLGYPLWSKDHPHGISSSLPGPRKMLPFIKRGTLSAIDSTNPNSVVLYIDGINNKGFSGGPILYWSFSAHAYRILGVIHGYLNDEFPQEWTINGQKVSETVLANSGILIGYSIRQVVDTIKASQSATQCKS
jgi:S1-C subfamily serine protease